MDRFRLRVWNNKTKEFIDPMDWSYWDLCFWYEPYKRDIEPVLMDMDYYEIEQCTGLKDKNGFHIYEGDIVKLSSDREVVCPVVWDNEETGFCVKYKKELYRFNTYKKYHLIEVIGNIHENPELLEANND